MEKFKNEVFKNGFPHGWKNAQKPSISLFFLLKRRQETNP